MSAIPTSRRVLIAGGGIAALEGMFAIRDLTDGAADVTLLSPEREFVYRPLMVLEPFSPEPAPRRDLPALLAEHDGRFVEDRLSAVDPSRGVAITDSGQEISFDYALIAVGARMLSALPSVQTLWVERPPTPIETHLDRAVAGGGLDLIVPPGVTWSLPLYEFALMAERRCRERGESVPIRVITPEESPLAVFGPVPSAEVAGVLEARGIGVEAGVWVTEAQDGSLEGRGRVFEPAGYSLALPTMQGIPVDGLPSEGGFIPIDEWARVRDLENVYAAGDGTAFPIKQGGVATQQADVAAERIAAAMGAAVAPRAERPVLRGKLLTGSESVNMRTVLTGGDGEGVVSSDHLWWPPHKVSGRYLAPWLAGESLHMEPAPPTASVDVEAPALPPSSEAADRADA